MFSYKLKERGSFYELIKYNKVYRSEEVIYKIDIEGSEEKGERELTHLRRIRRNIRGILELNLKPMHMLITLTYAENMQDYDVAVADFKRFIRRLGNPEYLRVIELQKRGAIHFHVIIFDFLNTDLVFDSWEFGIVDIKDIEEFNVDALANYFGKYVAQLEKGQVVKSGRRIFTTSRGVKRYQEVVLDEDVANMLIKGNKHLKLDYKHMKKFILVNDWQKV